MSPNSSWSRIGRIVATFGLKGQVKVDPLTDFHNRFAPGSRVRINGEWTTIEAASEHRAQFILKLEKIDNIEEAERLRGVFLEVAGDDKPKLDRDEYLTSDLIGLKAKTPEGETLGTVDEVIAAPAHDVLVIGDILVPAVKAFVQQVDLAGGNIVVKLIPGMKPEDDSVLPLD